MAAADGESANPVSGEIDPEFRLTYAQAQKHLDAENLASLSYEDILEAFKNDSMTAPYLPSGIREQDPRSHLPVYFSEARSNRPHSYGHKPGSCPICAGAITKILDLHRLPSSIDEEFCFINKNLYPVLSPEGGAAWGLHFLIWPSTIHSRNFRNMEPGTVSAVLERIALLERKLLLESGESGYACLIKNEGVPVGGSIEHDHFQMLHTFDEPLAFRFDRQFQEEAMETFTKRFLSDTGMSIPVADEGIWTVCVPRFMKRPYDAFIVCRDEKKRFMHELAGSDLSALALVLKRLFLASDGLFNSLGRQHAFNLVLHNSGCSALYFEFLPFTQESGGFEQLGISSCQTLPDEAAAFYSRNL